MATTAYFVSPGIFRVMTFEHVSKSSTDANPAASLDAWMRGLHTKCGSSIHAECSASRRGAGDLRYTFESGAPKNASTHWQLGGAKGRGIGLDPCRVAANEL